VSRARCVAVLVASLALFQVECKNPRQIMLANAFCRYLEIALPIWSQVQRRVELRSKLDEANNREIALLQIDDVGEDFPMSDLSRRA
jgi:hypothetical protein